MHTMSGTDQEACTHLLYAPHHKTTKIITRCLPY